MRLKIIGMINKGLKYVADENYRFIVNAYFGKYNSMPDKDYLERKYKAKIGKKLNLDRPQTFNEKLQWLKLYDRNPIYTTMVDKYAVKKYVSDIIGEEHVVQVLGVWDNSDEIDFESLPNQFVLKCNHDSGSVVICKDKSKFDREKVRKWLASRLKKSGFDYGREWPYKNVKPCIIAEKYMIDDENGDLVDYKIHNFNGIPKVILVCRDRFKGAGLTEDFYSDTWEHLNVQRPDHPNGKNVPKPAELEEMLELSRRLSKGIPFVRTDFYIINHKVYFGEITFFPASGFQPFIPGSFDKKMGDWLKLPDRS